MCNLGFTKEIQLFTSQDLKGKLISKLRRQAGSFRLFPVMCCICLLSVACQKNITHALKKPTGTFKVALVLQGGIDNQSRTQIAYESLLAVSEKLNIPVAYRENINEPNEEEQAFRAFAKEGYNFIIGFSGQYVHAMEQIANDYPQINFAVASYYEGNNKNLGGIFFRNEEAGFISGVVAALKSKTGRIGFIGGVPYPHIVDQMDFYKKGARFVNPSIHIDIKWLNSFQDHQLATNFTEAMAKGQIDVILSVADETNLTVAKTAETLGISVMGSVNNSIVDRPKSLIAYCMQDASRLILEGVLLAQKGQWEGKQYKFGFREEAQMLTPFLDCLSKEKQDFVNKCIDQIIMGEIELLKS